MAKESVVTDYMDACLICGGRRENIHHLIPGTANRKKSDKYGLVIPLCNACHNTTDNSMHGNTKMMALGRAMAQIAFEKEACISRMNASPNKKEELRRQTRELFIREFGKAYI